MSFEIFFHAYKHGKPCAFPLSEAEAAFHAALVHRERTQGGFFWRLEYPVLDLPDVPPVMEFNGQQYPVSLRDGSEIYGTTQAGVDSCLVTNGFMVKGPAAHHEFYGALLRLLQTTHSALFWPGNNSLVIGRMESRGHLPEGMLESLGEPILVTTPQQIIDRIRAS